MNDYHNELFKHKETRARRLHVCIHNVHLCTHTHYYIHTVQVGDIDTCTFSQSYKPIHLYSHDAADGPRVGCVQCTRAEAHKEEDQNPVSRSWV